MSRQPAPRQPAEVAEVPRTTQIWVTDVLRDRIMSGAAPVGTRLRQVDISAELGVSTTPVREAFRALAAEGLVRIDAHRGAVVHALTPAECIEVLELLDVIEADNLRHAVAAMTPDALAAAEAIQARMRRARPERWILLNRDFHLALGAPSGRRRALALLRDLLNLSALHIRDEIENMPGRMAEALAEHEELLAACRRGDGEEAAAIIHRHTLAPLNNLRRLRDVPAPAPGADG